MNQTMKYILAGVSGAVLVGGGVAAGVLLGNKDNTSTQSSNPVNMEVITTTALKSTIISELTAASTADTSVTIAETIVSTKDSSETAVQITTKAATNTITTTPAPIIIVPETVYVEPEQDEPEEPEPVETEPPATTKAPKTTKAPETLPQIEPKEVEPYYEIAAAPFIPNPNEKYVSWEDAYYNCIYGAITAHGDDEYMTFEVSPFGYAYDVVDMNADGIPELLISSGEFQYADLWLYTYVDGYLYLIDNFSGNGGVCSTTNNGRNIYVSSGYYGEMWDDVYELSGTKLTLIAGFYDTTQTVRAGDTDYMGYTVNGKKVKESDYTKLMNQYIKAGKNDVYDVGRRYPMMSVTEGGSPFA